MVLSVLVSMPYKYLFGMNKHYNHINIGHWNIHGLTENVNIAEGETNAGSHSLTGKFLTVR